MARRLSNYLLPEFGLPLRAPFECGKSGLQNRIGLEFLLILQILSTLLSHLAGDFTHERKKVPL